MMMDAPLIDLRPADWQIVRTILEKHVPAYEVWAFGSRARWEAKDYSDLDLAIITDRPLSLDIKSALDSDFSESDLPFKVDVVNWATVSPSFREIIQREKVVVKERKKKQGIEDRWRDVSIEDIALRVAMGPFGSDIKTDNFVSEGVPIIRGVNLTSGRFNPCGFVFLTEEKADELLNANAYPGDLVFTHRGTLGQIGLIPREPFNRYVVSQSQMKLTCNPSIADPLFIYYFFKSTAGQHALLRHTSQTGVPAISRPVTALKSIQLRLPPLSEQRTIAHILCTLDDKIELNKKMNETLEVMARALFKSWFVDFDPVRAKMDGRPTGLPSEIEELFPNEMVDSELGEIPKGWKVGSVDEEFNLTMGQSPPGETYNEEGKGPPFFQGRADFGFRFPSLRVFCTAPTRFAEVGDTLISVRAPVGDINMTDTRCCIGRGVAAARHKTGSRSYTYYFMHSIKEVFDRFEAEGTVFGSISKKDFHNIQHIMPPIEVVNFFERHTAPTDDKIEINDSESRLLSKLRDTLLPKLISGELCVPDAQQFTAEVTA